MSIVPESDSNNINIKSETDSDECSGKSAKSEIDPCLSSDLPVDEIKYPSFRDDPNVTGEVWDPLMRATYYQDLVKMVILLDAGHDIDYRTILSYTSLHRATLDNFYDGVSLLLNRGADINAVTNNDTHAHEKHPNSTALILAAGKGYFEIVKLLYWTKVQTTIM